MQNIPKNKVKEILNEVKSDLGKDSLDKIDWRKVKVLRMVRELWDDPVKREAHIAKYRGKKKNFSAEEIRKRRKRCLERNADPEFHKNKSFEFMKDPEWRKNKKELFHRIRKEGHFDHYLKGRKYTTEVRDRINVHSGVVTVSQLQSL